jgi:hypothetical protein
MPGAFKLQSCLGIFGVIVVVITTPYGKTIHEKEGARPSDL